jgi:hypothetical protein
MPLPSTSLEAIEDFLAQKRIALVGMSRDPKSMSAVLYKELFRRGYDVVLVNPNVQEIMGQKCFARLQDIGAVSEHAVEVCRQRGISVVPGECPLMFLPKSGGIHSFHGFLRKLTGRYPKHSHA